MKPWAPISSDSSHWPLAIVCAGRLRAHGSVWQQRESRQESALSAFVTTMARKKQNKKKRGLEMCCLIAVMAALVVVMGAGGGAIVLVEITVVRASILERKSPLPSRPHQSPPTSTISFPLAMMSPCPTHTCRKILYSHRNKYSPCELWHTGFQKICGTDALRCAWKCGFGSAKLPSLNILIKDRMYYSRTSAPENNTA